MNGPIPARWGRSLHGALRIVAGLLFLMHGTQKLFNWPVPFPMPLEPFSMFWIAGVLEAAGGLLIILGLFTRPVAFVLAGEMAYAYFFQHMAKGGIYPLANQGEPAVLYCFIFLYLAATGPGPLALDRERAIRK